MHERIPRSLSYTHPSFVFLVRSYSQTLLIPMFAPLDPLDSAP